MIFFYKVPKKNFDNTSLLVLNSLHGASKSVPHTEPADLCYYIIWIQMFIRQLQNTK